MGRIHILDEGTINQIAAGEVVERPASVVKELVENSIDAEATRIIIKLEEGGKALIQIRDDGCGMSREDALMAFEKHATSKIRAIGDLQKITTLGFRGEALSSIASVSQLTIITRTAPSTLDAEDYAGTKLVIDGGEMKTVEDIGCPAGTTITVENLFFNVPARLKYMKTARTELNHVLDIITARSIANPDIYFELTHEGRRLIFSPGSGNRLEIISSLLGKKAAREMLEILYSGPRAEVRGYISRPSWTRANQKHIFIFVNGRPVRSPRIVRAIRDGYGNLLPPVRYPVVVLELYVDPNELDANIHPTKSEVKFQYPDDIYISVSHAVKFALEGKDLSVRTMPETLDHSKIIGKRMMNKKERNKMMRDQLKFSGKKGEEKPAVSRSEAVRGEYADSCGEGIEKERSSKEWKVKESVPEYGTALLKEKQIRIDEQKEDSLTGMTRKLEAEGKFVESALPGMRPIGQVHNMFILVETPEGIGIIDQHAAHEKVLYERLKKDYRKEAVKSQRLIEPFQLELAPEEQEVVRAYQSLLDHLGFEIEAFGGNTFMVKTIPIILGNHATPEMVYDIIDELVVSGKTGNLEDRKDDMLKLLACHSSIRGGEELTMPRIIAVLEELYALENPFSCPHGRPTMIQLPKKELEKKFKRTGF